MSWILGIEILDIGSSETSYVKREKLAAFEARSRFTGHVSRSLSPTPRRDAVSG
jgi:hypothetical protein